MGLVVFILFLLICMLLGVAFSGVKKRVSFQGKITAKEKMSEAGLVLPVSEIPSNDEESGVVYRVLIEYEYPIYKWVRGEAVKQGTETKTSEFLCRNEVEFVNYEVGETYWFIGCNNNVFYEVLD